MKRACLFQGFIMIMVFMTGLSCQKEQIEEDDIEKGTIQKSEMMEAESKFALSVFSKIQEIKSDTNICISPYSLYEALAMTANGAAGTTLQEFLDVMELENDCLESLNNLAMDLRTSMVNDDPNALFQVANSFWYNQNYSIYPEFTENLQGYYQARVSSLDFTNPAAEDSINNWVSDYTHDRITDLIRGILPSDMCFLINAIYFKGTWSDPFKRDITVPASFRLCDGTYVICSMMQRYGILQVYNDDQHLGVKLPYSSGAFAMYIFMPKDRNQNLADYFAQDFKPIWPGCLDDFVSDTTRLGLPQFRIENDYTLNDMLKSLGLVEAFASSANFSKLTDCPAWISKVRQKTFINVNEDGTEGAAATAVSICGSGMYTYDYSRPFIYLIADTESGTPIFMGQVTHPNEI